MLGLILKDVYLVRRYILYLTGLLLLLSLSNVAMRIPNMIMLNFTLLGTLFPFMTIALDQQKDTLQFVLAAPLTARDYTMSKYLGGWSLGLAVALITFALRRITGASFADAADSAVFVLAAHLLLLSVSLPAVLRFGVQKGKAVLIPIVFLFTIVTYGGGLRPDRWSFPWNAPGGSATLVFVAAGLTALSLLSFGLSVLAVRHAQNA